MPQINDLTLLTSPTGTESALVSDAGGTLKRILVNTIAQFTHPVGSAYTQYYGLPTPSTLWGGTWALMYNTSAVCFMTESAGGATYEAETFDGVVKDSQLQGHWHTNASRVASGGSQSRIQSTVDGNGVYGDTSLSFASTIITDGTNGTPRVGKATKPRRVIVRVWQRTA